MNAMATSANLASARLLVARRISPGVHRFRALQDPSGRVVADRAQAATTLRALFAPVAELGAELGCQSVVNAFTADAERWLARGLDEVPSFEELRAAYRPPENGQVTFFIGPTLAQNGPPPRGHFLELFLALREEPSEVAALAETFVHPKNPCQSTRLLEATLGFGTGNCVVFFPEYISASTAVDSQQYAVFFFNKFIRIYLQQTMPRVVELLGAGDQLFGGDAWRSTQLSAEAFYRLRCVWGYLHDYFHHSGPRPLDRHLNLKQDWHAGVVEELKVDCQTVLAAAERRFDGWRELVEFILFERMFRYPAQGDSPTNFDSATGCLLFDWLWRRGALRSKSGALGIDYDVCLDVLRAFVRTAEEIERISDDAEYLAGVNELVRRHLRPNAPGQSESFRVPESYLRHAPVKAPLEPLDMANLPY